MRSQLILPPQSEVWTQHGAFAALSSWDFLGAGVNATTYNPASNQFSATGSTGVTWRDYLFVPGAQSGSTKRLSFSVESIVAVERVSRAGVSVNWSGGQSVLQLTSGFNQNSGGNFDLETVAVGWDALSRGLLPNSYIGTMHMDVLYDDATGGYYWELKLNTFVSTFDIDSERVQAVANSLNSIGLISVTELDGTAVTSFNFDSGMIVSVPESNSASLICVGAFFVATVRFSRRRSKGGV